MSTRGRSSRAALGSAFADAAHQALISKEIKAVISDLVEKIDDGSRLVQQAGSTVQEGGGSVHRVRDIVAEISAAGAARASRRPGRRRRVEPDLARHRTRNDPGDARLSGATARIEAYRRQSGLHPAGVLLLRHGRCEVPHQSLAVRLHEL